MNRFFDSFQCFLHYTSRAAYGHSDPTFFIIAIAEKAYKGLIELSRSENEYIWEVSTQLLASYEHLIIEECAER